MAKKSKTACIGILTAGGDCPGLNAAIRAIAKPAMHKYGMRVIGILDGFRGLVENRTIQIDDRAASGILTIGGTILGTGRDKLHMMEMGGKTMDMTDAAVANIKRLHIDCLVCLGGGGTQKNAFRLHKKSGLNVMTLPKTIDNDVAGTDVSFGFDTARSVATDAIDRLHTTASSHNRIMVCEIMGHRAGWLALSSGLAGGADVILIPELPYDLDTISRYLMERRRSGKRFSIIAAAEGALSTAAAEAALKAEQPQKKPGKKERSKKPVTEEVSVEPAARRIARQLEERTGTEARVTSLGHIQRGGIPTAFDRMLCTLLGTKAAQLLADGAYNVMVAFKGGTCEPVPLKKVAGLCKTVPIDDPMIESARLVGTCFGDE